LPFSYVSHVSYKIRDHGLDPQDNRNNNNLRTSIGSQGSMGSQNWNNHDDEYYTYDHYELDQGGSAPNGQEFGQEPAKNNQYYYDL